MTVGVPVPSLKPPTYVSGIYQKNIQTLSTEIKQSHARSVSNKKEPAQFASRRRSLDSQRILRSSSTAAEVLKDGASSENRSEQNARTRRLSGSSLAVPRLNRTIEKKREDNEEQQKKPPVLSRRRSIDPSSLARLNSVKGKENLALESFTGADSRVRRFSGSGISGLQQIKTTDKKAKTEDVTPTTAKKTAPLSRRRTMDPSSVTRNEQLSLDDSHEKMRTLAIIAEKRKKKREDDERKKKEDQENAELYEKKFISFKTKARLLRSANGELTERITNLQNEMMEINFRLSQLTTERVIHMIETVLNA